MDTNIPTTWKGCQDEGGDELLGTSGEGRAGHWCICAPTYTCAYEKKKPEAEPAARARQSRGKLLGISKEEQQIQVGWNGQCKMRKQAESVH